MVLVVKNIVVLRFRKNFGYFSILFLRSFTRDAWKAEAGIKGMNGFKHFTKSLLTLSLSGRNEERFVRVFSCVCAVFIFVKVQSEKKCVVQRANLPLHLPHQILRPSTHLPRLISHHLMKKMVLVARRLGIHNPTPIRRRVNFVHVAPSPPLIWRIVHHPSPLWRLVNPFLLIQGRVLTCDLKISPLVVSTATKLWIFFHCVA